MPQLNAALHPSLPSTAQQPIKMARLFDYTVMPLLLPFLLLWLLAARLLSLLAPLLLPPLSIALNRKLVWACPIIPSIWAEKGWFKGNLMRLGFEYSYTAVSGEWCAWAGGRGAACAVVEMHACNYLPTEPGGLPCPSAERCAALSHAAAAPARARLLHRW